MVTKHFALIVLLCTTLLSANAQNTVGKISGTVQRISDPGGLAPAGVSIGDIVSTQFTYAAVSSIFDLPGSFRQYNFINENISMVTTIGALTWSTSRSGYVYVENDNAVHQRDIYSVASFWTGADSGSFPGALSSSYLHIGMADGSAPYELLSSLGLPRSTLDINLLARSHGLVYDSDSGISSSGLGPFNNWNINYTIESFSLTSVPEPSIVSLFCISTLLFVMRTRGQVSRLPGKRKT